MNDYSYQEIVEDGISVCASCGNANINFNKPRPNKNLDMSWISDDNAKNLPYELKAQTIDEEVSESDYMTLNNLDISNYYNDNNITVGNTYPKIYEDKRSTGYTYDRSKVQGLDSIAFSGIME